MQARVERLAAGNPDPHRAFTGGASELKTDCGPGYLVEHLKRGDVVIVLLAGGDKSMRKNDINIAVAPAKNSCDPPWVPVWTWRSSRSGR